MKNWHYTLLIILLALVGFFFYLRRDYPQTPSTLYVNGNFLTLDPTRPTAEAMLVRNGRIEAIGTTSTLEAAAPKSVHIVNLNGQTVMPGFIDPHTHFALSMFLADLLDLSGFRHASSEAVWEHFAQAVQTTPKGNWIVGKGIDPIMIDNLTMPTLSLLDSLAPDHPVLLFSQSLHSYWANSLAFARAGITASTPDPTEKSYYEKDAAGNLTGLIVEQAAILPIFDLLKQEVTTPARLTQAAAKVALEYAQNGNTTLVSAGLTITDAKPLILLRHLSDRRPTLLGNLLAALGKLPQRHPTPRHFIYLRHDMAHLRPEARHAPNDFFDIIGVKHWYDGSPYIGSMYLDTAYLDTPFAREKADISPGQRGEALVDPKELRQFIQEYHEKGWQIAIHTQGDAAIREVLDAFEAVSKEEDFSQSRHRLEHCLLLPETELERMQTLHITPSFHINHLYYYGDALTDGLLGPDRTGRILPLGATVGKGIPFSLHADQPMFPSQPFRLIQTAVERQTRSGKLIGPEQRIALLEAIKALTVHAAWQIGKENSLGTLEPGKYADFIVLDRDPFSTPTGELQHIRVLATYVNGNRIP